MEKTPRREIRFQESFNDFLGPKSTYAKTQIVFLISEGDYGNMGAKTPVMKPRNVNLNYWSLRKVKTVPNHWRIHENTGERKYFLPTC